MTTRKGARRMESKYPWADELCKRGHLSARGRILRVLGRRRLGAELLARSIATAAGVPIRSLGVELVNLKRFGVLTCVPVPKSWWGEVGHRARLWSLTAEGRRIYRVIGR